MDPQQRAVDRSPQQEFKQNLTQYVQYNVGVNNLRQFVQDNKEQYKKVLQEEFKQINKKEAEIAAKKELINKKQMDAEKGLANAQQKIEEGRALKEKGKVFKEEGRALKEEGRVLKEEGRIHLEKAKALRQYGEVKIFCVALGLPVPKQDEIDKINDFVSKYSLDSAIEVSKDKTALISTNPFEIYLKEKSTTLKQLNLTPIRVLKDPKNFVEFMKKNGIKFIGFDACVKESIEPELEKVCPISNRSFKVMYVEPKNK